jgi:pimeloyl-ACP methyl ester carboxylesterase
MRVLTWIIIGAAAVYLAVTAAAYIMQRSLLYFPPARYVSPLESGVPFMRDVQIMTSYGASVSWYVPAASGDKPVVMFFHGNGSAVYSGRDIFKDLRAQGYGVLSVSYPGYPHKDNAGGGSGQPTESGLIAAALESYSYLRQAGIPPERIIYYGTSLGSGVAAQLTAQHPPALLIMEAPFNSVLDMGKMRISFLPVRVLLKDKFRSDLALATYNGPLIWMHGTGDQIIPLAQGRKLYDGYNGPKTAHVFDGGLHTNLWARGGREVIFTRLAEMFPDG